jgi:hypothetical protein
MGIATNWSNHLLVWFLSSNQIRMLDRLTKSTVGFGRQAPAPLYPRPLGNLNPGQP